jgi:hypothetical protein
MTSGVSRPTNRLMRKEPALMVTPGFLFLALLAGIAMLVVIDLIVALPHTGHFAHLAH